MCLNEPRQTVKHSTVHFIFGEEIVGSPKEKTILSRLLFVKLNKALVCLTTSKWIFARAHMYLYVYVFGRV